MTQDESVRTTTDGDGGLAEAVARVEGLVGLARTARTGAVDEVLEAVAVAVRGVAGFGGVVVNVYRPAWDDYEAVIVLAEPEEAGTALLGTTNSASTFDTLFSEVEPLVPGVYLMTAAAPSWPRMGQSYQRPRSRPRMPGIWQPEDGILLQLRGSDGEPLGVLSMDEPLSGRYPRDGELRLLRAICSHAEQALESARERRRAAEVAEMDDCLVAMAPVLSSSASIAGVAEVVNDAVVTHFGFERIAFYERDEAERFELVDSRGWAHVLEPATQLSIRAVASLLGERADGDGCALVPARRLAGDSADAAASSRRNGHGPQGWHDDALVVAARDAAGRMQALLVLEDPIDHQLPPAHRRRALRQLVDHAAAATRVIRLREIHDRLVELVLAREGPVALSEALAERIECPVAVFDWRGQLIADASWQGRRTGAFTLEELLGESTGLGPQSPSLVTPLTLDDEPEGYLVVLVNGRPAPEAEIAQAVVAFELQLAMLRNAEELEYRVRGDLVDQLLDEPVPDIEALGRRAQRLGHELAVLDLVLALQLADPPDPPASATLTRCARCSREVVDQAHPGSIVAARGDSIVILVADGATAPYDLLIEMLFSAALRATGRRLLAGVSHPVESPAGLAGAIREARHAVRAAARLPHLSPVAVAGQLDLHHLLLTAPRSTDLDAAARRLLQPLRDPRLGVRSEVLLQTLTVYLSTVGNLEQTARTLDIHINTLRRRIARIEELLGLELRDATSRLNLQLALELVDGRL